MVKFSLIIPTIGRVSEVEKLLQSIESSTYKDFEVIVVDQNKGYELDKICRSYAMKFKLTHIKVDFCGAARARNYGTPYAVGEIINFPDDDCEFTEDLLSNAAFIFCEHPNLDFLFGRTVDKNSQKNSVINFAGFSQNVSMTNLHSTAVECTMFVKKSVFNEIGQFDESLGVGTFYGAEEGADLFLRAIYKMKTLYYDPELLFYHPQKVKTYDYSESLRALNYGKGFGRLVVKHLFLYRNKYLLYRFLQFQFRSVVAIILFSVLLKPRRVNFYVNSFKGRIIGFCSSVQDFIKWKNNSTYNIK